MAFKKNKVKANLGSYPYFMLLAPKKFGKTTFWNDLVPIAWGNEDRGLLISCGNEEGYHSLEDIQVEVAKEWDAEYDEETELRGFVQTVDDIVENNNEYNIKGVCIDTLDTFVDVLTKEVLKQHFREKRTRCKTLNEAFSGYGRGVDRLLDIADEQLERLRGLGIAIFFLCHTKNKERTDMVSGDKFEMITNNLQDKIFNHFADAAQMVMVGVLDRKINDGKILSEDRVVYLRGTSQIDAGSRFHKLDKEKISLDPKEFMEVFEGAVKNEINYNRQKKASLNGEEYKEITKEEMDVIKKEEQKELDKKAKISKERKENLKINPVINEDLIKVVKNKLPSSTEETQKIIKEIVSESGCEKITVETPTAVLEKIVEVLG